jgi:outer membrane protein, heavy metal efflux system
MFMTHSGTRCGGAVGGACARLVYALIVFFLATGGWARAQTSMLSERDAIASALAQPAFRAVEDNRLEIAESAVAQAGLPPNPGIGLSRETVGVIGGTGTESALHVTQAFDISGRRALRREAAEQRLDASKWDRDAVRARLVLEVRQAFAEALYRDRLRSGLRTWSQRIDAAHAMVSQLAKAGEASGYARRRLEREQHAAQARIARADADYGRVRELLFGIMGASPSTTLLTGNLIPAEPPTLAIAQARLRQRPELKSLMTQAEAFERERRAAARAWVPDLTLGAGAKRIQEPTRSDNGTIFTVAIPIPLFDRGQAAEKRASAEAATTRAEYALRVNRWQAELRGIWQQTDELRRAALTFRKDTAALSPELSRVAEAAYRGGEATLLELLDAYRNELDAETTALELELAARQARVELDYISGMVNYE